MPAGVRVWGKATSYGRKVRRGSSLIATGNEGLCQGWSGQHRFSTVDLATGLAGFDLGEQCLIHIFSKDLRAVCETCMQKRE